MAAITPVHEFRDIGSTHDQPARGLEALLETGAVLSFGQLAFTLLQAERRFLDEGFADGKAKNISLRWPKGELRGATGTSADLAELKIMLILVSVQVETNNPRPSRKASQCLAV